MRLVDLSAPIAPSPEGTPPFLRTEIADDDHAASAAQIRALLGVPAERLRDGEGWAIETCTRFGTHASTHVDAPWHYNRHIQGQPAQTIDRLPREWFFSDGPFLFVNDEAWPGDICNPSRHRSYANEHAFYGVGGNASSLAQCRSMV